MTLAPLPEALTAIGSSPELTSRELVEAIEAAIIAHPRSQQISLGPSEIGQACGRRLAYKLLGHPEPRDAPWLPTIGTAVHGWLEAALRADNRRWLAQTGHERWLLEQRVIVGEVDGKPISGSADVYDRVTATVVDWKIVGPTTLKKYKSSGPGSQYRTQAHLYGRGFVAEGLPVERVMVAFLPRNAPLHEAYFWHEPYDEQIALAGLQRVNGLAIGTRLTGYRLLEQIPTVDDYCGFCPFRVVGSTDPEKGCPGHASAAAQPFADLLGTTQGAASK